MCERRLLDAYGILFSLNQNKNRLNKEKKLTLDNQIIMWGSSFADLAKKAAELQEQATTSMTVRKSLEKRDEKYPMTSLVSNFFDSTNGFFPLFLMLSCFLSSTFDLRYAYKQLL